MARIDGLIILDPNGKPLITSNFASHPPSYPLIHIDAFNHAVASARAEVTEGKGTANGASKSATALGVELEPVLWVNALGRIGPGGVGASGAALCHIERDGLRYLVPVSEDVNPLFAFSFIQSFLETLTEYLGDVTEGTVKDNFDIVYMLVEEMLDEGHPMTMETNMLKDIVIPPSLMRKLLNVAGVAGLQSQPTAPFTAPIPWRRQGVRHANNEIYFDIEETLDAIVDRRGAVLETAVWGRINANSRLSGNPDLVLNLANAKTTLRDPAFHPCVRHNRWERDAVLSFIPPDGKFKLVEYNSRAPVKQLPVGLKAKLTTEDNGGRFSLTLTSRMNAHPLEHITVSIFLGASTTSVSATATGEKPPLHTGESSAPAGRVGGGTYEFDPNTHVLKWHLASLVASERSPSLTGSFVSAGGPTPDPAFSVDFSVTGHTYSGLRVDGLKVLGEGYKPFKGVRTTAKSGRIDVRW
ncbi:AP-3 complex subunit mu-1 [Vanrija pseudolonga]|uniref:AP-3 complex subunit mu-1 n=1 Tax=Vanrija pseudolonga TaxID=143232 RepID=A0AAF0Y5K2_9TREE|nr:AP-3 complex subunit mu-1 [Vanrija pseudolonga]